LADQSGSLFGTPISAFGRERRRPAAAADEPPRQTQGRQVVVQSDVGEEDG
jgi:hypothetical protein